MKCTLYNCIVFILMATAIFLSSLRMCVRAYALSQKRFGQHVSTRDGSGQMSALLPPGHVALLHGYGGAAWVPWIQAG